MSSILSNSSLSLAAEVTDKIKTIKDKNYQISMRCRHFSKWQHIDTIGSCIDLFWLFHRFAINLYISRTSDKMNMLIKREKWREEGKISQRNRRNKKKREKYKRARDGQFNYCGSVAQFTTKKKKTRKNRYKFHFVFYPGWGDLSVFSGEVAGTSGLATRFSSTWTRARMDGVDVSAPSFCCVLGKKDKGRYVGR